MGYGEDFWEDRGGYCPTAAACSYKAGKEKIMSDKTNWQIRINGYGTFDFDGTEIEAEEMRAHKARWEGGNGMKWRTDKARESDKITAEIAEGWDSNEGVSQKLFTKLKAAKEKEAEQLEPAS